MANAIFWILITVVAVLASVSGWHFQQMLYNRRPGAPGSDHYFTLGAYKEADRYTAEGQKHRQDGFRFMYYGLALLLAIAVAASIFERLGW